MWPGREHPGSPAPGRPGARPPRSGEGLVLWPGNQVNAISGPGRAMARTGLRMMPTFPSPSLKFRTSGFPQYGFKASLSGRACPTDITVKPAPGMPAPSTSLPRPFARFRAGDATWHCVQITPRLHVPLCERPSPLYPRGPWLRSGFCCPGPSSRTPTPSAGLAGTRRFHGPAAYTPRLRCAGAPRRPARPSLLSLLRCPCVPSTLRRWVRGPVPLCWDRDARLPRATTESPPTTPVSASNPRRGDVFRRCIVRVMLRPACLPGPPDWLRREGPPALPPRLLRLRVTPAFRDVRHRPPLGVRLEGRTGNLPSSGLAPDQFAVGSEAAP